MGEQREKRRQDSILTAHGVSHSSENLSQFSHSKIDRVQRDSNHPNQLYSDFSEDLSYVWFHSDEKICLHSRYRQL